MEFKVKLLLLVTGIVLTGLSAGLCFTWANAVTPGIGRLNDFGYLSAFQAMNRAIVNGPFLLVFFGPVILLFINAFLFKSNTPTFWCFFLAALLFFFGVALMTVLGNVPLNEVLDKTDLDSLSGSELKQLRNRFEKPWNLRHWIRTITSTLAFILLLTGWIYSK